jgi:hypothetical protein
MAYIGQTPTAVPLDGDDLADNIITSAKIADGAIVNADINASADVATTKLGAGAVVQVVNVMDGAVATGTSTVGIDDTIPSSSEGTEFMTLAITPTNASNILHINVITHSANANGSQWNVAALFQDTGASAIAVGSQKSGSGTNEAILNNFTHRMVAGTVSETTFKVRIGSNSAYVITFNGFATNRNFGGTSASSITITEIQV